MAPTRAQKTAKGKKTYGENYARGVSAEERAARSLRGAGWSVEMSPESREVAKRKAMSHPHNARRPGPRGEIWVYDKNGRRYVI